MKFTEIDPGSAIAKIKVIGVGGGGCNAIDNMIASEMQGVTFIAANTDLQTLNRSRAEYKIQLGERVAKGLGAGASPLVGREAATESLDEIMRVLGQSEIVFVTAGMGGGTGTGAAPVIAQAAKETDALVVGVVTKPFHFEGPKRMAQAEAGVEELKKYVDSIITIPNDRLIELGKSKLSFVDAFKEADGVLHSAVRGISDIIQVPGLVNRDFADVRTIMQDKGLAMMGTGAASGDNRAQEAAMKAISSPLLEDTCIDGAMAVLYNITGNRDLGLTEINEVSDYITASVHPEANILFGVVIDDSLEDELHVTVIATGLEGSGHTRETIKTSSLTGRNVHKGPAPAATHGKPSNLRPIDFTTGATDRTVPAYVRKGALDNNRLDNNRLLGVSPAPSSDRNSRRHEPGKDDLIYDEAEMEIPTFIRRQAD